MLIKVELEHEGELWKEEAGRVGSRREEMGSSSFLSHTWVTCFC